MTLDEFKALNASQKIVLMTLDYPTLEKSFVDYVDATTRTKATVWAYRLVTRSGSPVAYDFGAGCFGYGGFEGAGDEIIGGNSAHGTISSMAVDGAQYNKMSSVANVVAQEESFFYDAATTVVYMHFSGNLPPSCFSSISLGLSSAYSSQTITLDNAVYEERITDVSPISKSKDSLSFGKLVFTSGNIALQNTDGFFDALAPEHVFGQRVTLAVIGPDMVKSEAYKLFTGFVENYSINEDKFTLQFSDDRKRLQKSIPVDHFDLARWPFLGERSVDKPIPLAYGPIRNAPVVCLNEAEQWQRAVYIRYAANTAPSGTTPSSAGGHAYVEGDRIIWYAGTGCNQHIYQRTNGSWQSVVSPADGMTVMSTAEGLQFRYSEEGLAWNMVATDQYPSTYTFKVADTSAHPITSLSRVYIDDVEVPYTNLSLANGTFNVAAEYFPKGKKVGADFVGADITNAIDALQDVLGLYFSIPYTSDTYDTAEWETARGKVPLIQLYLDKETPAISVIEQISTSCFGSFIVKADGRYSFRIHDPDAPPVYRVNRDEQLEVPQVSYDSTQFATQVVVQYDKDFANNEYSTYLDDSRAFAIRLTYGAEQSRSYQTLLTRREDAVSLASRIMDVAERVPRIYTTKSKLQPADYDLSDNMIVQSDRMSKIRYGLATCEVIGITHDLQAMETTLKHRWLADYFDPEPIRAGTWTREHPFIPKTV